MEKKSTILFYISLYILSVLALSGCGEHATVPVRTPHDAYTISIAADCSIPITVSYTVNQGTRFVLPFHFYDNPVDSFDGPLVINCTAVDAEGNAITVTMDSTTIGPIVNRTLSLPGSSTYPITFTYQLDLSVLSRDSLSKDMPRIFRNESSLYLQGAYCFIIPELGTDLTHLWRTSYVADIEVLHDKDKPIYGIPCGQFSCANIYELLFLQFSSSPRVVTQGHGGGVDFIVTDFFNKSYRPELCDSVSNLLGLILDELSSIYGSFGGSVQPCLPYTVTLHPLWGALEGAYGFASREPEEGTDGRFGEIVIHEALHHFIGIGCGDYDDPWWKEAAATYLGLETAVRLGLYDKEAFRQRITPRFFGADSARFQKALSDPWLRSHMFAENSHMIVYDRGSQVMMLLDVMTRTGSDNRYTLHQVMADLTHRFSGSAFTRSDFIAALRSFGAGNTENVFATYVDRPDSVLSADRLEVLFSSLDSLASW